MNHCLLYFRRATKHVFAACLMVSYAASVRHRYCRQKMQPATAVKTSMQSRGASSSRGGEALRQQTASKAVPKETGQRLEQVQQINYNIVCEISPHSQKKNRNSASKAAYAQSGLVLRCRPNRYPANVPHMRQATPTT